MFNYSEIIRCEIYVHYILLLQVSLFPQVDYTFTLQYANKIYIIKQDKRSSQTAGPIGLTFFFPRATPGPSARN